MGRLEPENRWGRALLIAWTLVAALVGADLVQTGLRDLETARRGKPVDFIVDWGGANMLVQGLDPYRWEDIRLAGLEPVLRQNLLEPPYTLGHPPTAFIWMVPLVDLPVQAAKQLWVQISILLVTLLVAFACRSLRYASPVASAVLVLGLVFTCSWFVQHLRVGQLGALIAFLYFLAWRFLRRGNEWAAGAMLGLACTMKSYPAAILLAFLVAGRWRVMAASVGVWLAVAIPVTIRLGWKVWPHFVDSTRLFTERWVGDIRNASLLGIFQRLHHPVCETTAKTQKVWTPAVIAAVVVGVGLVVLAARLTRRSLGDPRRVDAAFAALAALSMMTGHLTWEHYSVTLILPFLIAVAAIAAARRAGLHAGWTALAMVVVYFTVKLVRIDLMDKIAALAEYRARPPTGHTMLHLLEVASWAPPLLLFGVLLALAVWLQKREPVR